MQYASSLYIKTTYNWFLRSMDFFFDEESLDLFSEKELAEL